MIAATAMIGVLAIGGISAYFTDGDTATNTFTVGKVSIDLQEPNWNPPKDITPNQEIKRILRSRMMVSMMHTCL